MLIYMFMYIYIILISLHTYILFLNNDNLSLVARLRVKDGSLLQQANFANALKDP